jgi:hypothetical protein
MDAALLLSRATSSVHVRARTLSIHTHMVLLLSRALKSAPMLSRAASVAHARARPTFAHTCAALL